MTAATFTDQHLNVLVVRGTGFPEECLRSDSLDPPVSLTQAIDTFAERAVQGALSCIAVGPAWASDETYLIQALQQVHESTGVLIPEGDLKLAHFVGAHGLTVFEIYNERSDWAGVITKLAAALYQSSPQPVQPPKGKVIPMPTPSVPVPLARIAAALAVPVLGGLGMFVADSWEVQDARMSAINVPAVVAAFEPRFEGEAVPSWDDVEALKESGALAPEVEAAVDRPTTEEIGIPAALDENPGLYMLVAGAFSVEANAQVLANDLVANGFDAQVFEQDGGLHIVTYATHLDEQSARMHLEELRTQRISENAWLKPWKVIR